MNTLEFTINGMSCGHCVGQVTKALTELGGVIVNRITVGFASVSYDPARITPSRILEAVTEAGYDPVLPGRVA